MAVFHPLAYLFKPRQPPRPKFLLLFTIYRKGVSETVTRPSIAQTMEYATASARSIAEEYEFLGADRCTFLVQSIEGVVHDGPAS